MRIPVHHYIEITATMTPKDLIPFKASGNEWYLTNVGGKGYFVEIWR